MAYSDDTDLCADLHSIAGKYRLPVRWQRDQKEKARSAWENSCERVPIQWVVQFSVGYWDYDELMPVHYINISRDYADDIEAQAVKTGLQPFRTDLNVMMASSTNIQGQMEQVDTDLGYTWDSYTDPNSVRIGVNWGYTSSQLESQLDPELMIAIAAFLLLVIFTGYLIIYNIFQISVAGDIRFYGLLKTIGTTPRQLKRIIRQQALLLCLIGIPAGLLLGYHRAGGTLKFLQRHDDRYSFPPP